MYDFLEDYFNKLKKTNQFRTLRTVGKMEGKYLFFSNEPNKKYLNFSTNDYLGLSQNAEIQRRLINKGLTDFHLGNTASRLTGGNLAEYERLENKISEWKERPSLFLSSGYLANIGILPSLNFNLINPNKKVVYLVDKLSHASIWDGIGLLNRFRPSSSRNWMSFPHNDLVALAIQLEKLKRDVIPIIVTESVFSMDGDRAPLGELITLAKEYEGMLYVDEAHATGVLGVLGQGLLFEKEYLELRKYEGIISMSTMGKGLGSYGAVVSLAAPLKEYLINQMRSFIFTTALPRYILESCLEVIEYLNEVANKEGSPGASLLAKADYFRQGLLASCKWLNGDAVIGVENSTTHIIPLICGSNENTEKLNHYLFDHGVYASLIRPPTVSPNKSRVRFSLNDLLEYSDLDEVLGLLERYS